MVDSLLLVRRRIARIEQRAAPAGAGLSLVRTGHQGIDSALGGGLMRGRLHELIVDDPDAGSGSGFAAMIAGLIDGEILWLSEEAVWRRAGALDGTGLAAIGFDPARLILALLPDAKTVLRAAVDALRCAALGGVVIVLVGDPPALDLTASRRLLLIAEENGVTPLLLRLGGTRMAGTAQTRWRVAAAPSRPLLANAPGPPAWEVELLRQRGRPAGGIWRVEWDRERGRLRDWHDPTQDRHDETAFSGAVAAFPADRSAGSGPALRKAG